MNVLSVECLEKRIVKAIKAGNHDTQKIIEFCGAELSVINFCHALGNVQQKGEVFYVSGKGYLLDIE